MYIEARMFHMLSYFYFTNYRKLYVLLIVYYTYCRYN